MTWVLLLGVFCCIAQLTSTEARGSVPTWSSHHSRHVLEAAAAATGAGAGAAGQQQDAASTAALCAKWGLQPAAADAKPPRLFDFFIASHELDMIEIRLHETHHELDHIFILESRQTFRGKPKPLAYPHAIHRLRGDIINKVHYAVVDNLVGNSSWNKEEYQRTQLFDTALRASGLEPEPHDILMVSDLDEIPQPQFLRAMKRCTGLQYPAALLGDNHYYSYNYVNGQQWGLGPLAIKAEQRKYWTSQTLRSSTQWRYNINVTQYRQASWHCSYCFSHATAFQKKLASFSHKEFDTPYYHDVTRLVGCLKEGWGLFQQNIGAPGVQPEYMRVPTDKVDAPQYVLKHPKRFAYLISRDGDSGGLVDVQMRAGKAQLKQHRQRKGPEHRRRVRG